MAIYVYTDEPSNRYQPTEYTIAYYPLNQNTQLTDQSGNGYDLTTTGQGTNVYDNLGATFSGNGSMRETSGVTEMQGVLTARTVNVRAKILQWDSAGFQIVNMGDAYTNNSGTLIVQGIREVGKITLGNQGTVPSGYLSPQLNTRYNFVATYTPGSMKLYVNGNTTPVITWNVTLSASANGKLSLGNIGSLSSIVVSEAIFESKEWTAQEIHDYYEQTKDYYNYNGYQEVEYIQSSGTQYINTGYNPKTNTGFEIEYEITAYIQRYGVPMGTRYNDRNQAFYFGYENNDNSYYGFGNNKADPSTVAFHGVGTRRTITYHNNVLSNGTQTVNVTTNQQPYGNLKLFCEENNGSISEQCSMKLYSCKIREGNTLIFDFMPCYRINDGEIGLYDKVNDVFYTNQGTGTFTKGSDVN